MDAVEDIKERLNIEDVIGEYVELKRAGRNFRGLSPFTSERSPSFMVSPEKQIWHDFSSGKGGNMFSFVMEVEGLDFKGALELLARKAGVDLAQYRSGRSDSNGKRKERLYEVLELATKFYQVQFSKNNQALEYILKQRQFSKQTALDWRIGYAPQGGSALTEFLKSKKFTDDEIKGAGLSARGYRGATDMFRGRIMIPLADPQGRIIGFTARLLTDQKNAPKYINTPQTLLYDKARHVFGLHHAKEAIRKHHFVVVAEGNLDVIASYQAGLRHVVATAGTALTEYHLKALSRFTEDIRLSFDADKAGVAATERSIPIASKVGVSLSIVTIPSGKDPDELIRQDPRLWSQTVEQAQYALDWLIERYAQVLDLTSAQGKREFSTIIMKVVAGLKDPVEREHYIGVVAELLHVSTEALLSKTEKRPVAAKKAPPTQPQLDKAAIELARTQNHLLAVVLHQPPLRNVLEPLYADMFIDERARSLFLLLREHPELPGVEEMLAAQEAPAVQKLVEYAKIISLQYEELYGNLDILELRYEAVRLQARLIEQYVRTKKQRLSEQLHTASDAEVQQLLTQAKELDALLGQIKET